MSYLNKIKKMLTKLYHRKTFRINTLKYFLYVSFNILLVKMYIYYFCYIFIQNFYAFIKFYKIIMLSHNAELKKKKLMEILNGNEKNSYLYTPENIFVNIY